MEHNTEILLGAHTSIAGGVHNALLEGKKIGATTVQIFTANQRQWKAKTIAQEEIDRWMKTLQETGLKDIMSHDSYLINLGSPDKEVLAKSKAAFKEEINRCLQLGVRYLNFHPGSALDDAPESCLKRIVESLLEMRPHLPEKSHLQFVIEMTAGQGSSVGWSFEQIAYLYNELKDKLPIGVCIDTCHIFAAGYDIRTKEGVESTFDRFDKIVGLKNLSALHVNDSLKKLGSRVDRHANLGEGLIGIEAFKAIMQHPKLRQIPKYLETPGGPTHWEKEIKLLRSFLYTQTN